MKQLHSILLKLKTAFLLLQFVHITNYNEEICELSYYIFRDKSVYKATVEIDGNKMAFKDDNGVAIKTFEKAE